MKEDLIRRLSQISAGVDIFTQSEVAEKDISDFPMLQSESKFLHITGIGYWDIVAIRLILY